MARIKASKGTAFVIHWQVPRKQRLIKWDAALIGVIVLSIAFLAARVYTAPAARLVNSLTQAHSVSVAVVPITVPGLITELNDTTPSKRVNAAQSLASMHAVGVTDALVAATYDPDASVREEAAAALGEIGTVQALTRLQELQIMSGDTYIEVAAFEAQGKIIKNIAAEFDVPPSGVQAWAVAQNGPAYAAIYNELFVRRGENWVHVSQLPDTPSSLSASLDGQALFLATNSLGLYRSQDSGTTWQPMQFGLQTPTQLTVTAVVVNPGDTTQVYIALSAAGSNIDQPNSLGVASSTDGGTTWVMLPDSPIWSVTRQLVLDRTAPGYLYGLSDVGPWRYNLTPEAAGSDTASRAPIETGNP